MSRVTASLRVILELGYKEMFALANDFVLVALIVYAFTFAIYALATGTSMELRHAAIGIVDEDHSAFSRALQHAFFPPQFSSAVAIEPEDIDKTMGNATYTFILDFPPHMESDLRSGKKQEIQLLIDATAVGQAQIGTFYIQKIIKQEAQNFFNLQASDSKIGLNIRYLYNQNQEHMWFTAINALIQNITMLAVLLTGAALIREREHGTIEHLLVMPVTPLEIVLSKVSVNSAVILLMAFISLSVVLQCFLGVQINGSIALFIFSTFIYSFFATGLGIFLGTLARSMPQFGLMFILIVLPMNLLSGGFTPSESMPQFLQNIMLIMPSTHYVALAQSILFRNATFLIVWPHILIMAIVGGALFVASVFQFRSFLGRQA